ncbi:negative elongation factor B-like isoform X1 [Varroa jacobsoni]|uniref:Negative elongation factor B n=1 Tax=Varroa destructor TaxID=109461 RepID=A0A7M7KYE8_VARDE|nr:negative elongation factor B-like isoform X1 [Varroa destructor]XP_022672430.1 negative elongation factor B-like isoform X1 [Varroa destructor]XP_022672431.1 negative elongation factor B-like isoform X1 [Varroa destructor]XP_022672432.1 negative elongation factor B-like isoform X1 [Varroa destructor]XP_022672433.1 negative elongation factor B-like isoform X1 [Varroa destructor]XP_022672434.1 negative elongation factor B-like isoform X1 [Varroa destructor]XP_022672435.1 negative elongation 
MAGLEEVDIPGREYLKETLTNCADPLTAIAEFQEENGILLPSLRTMLPLLDLHGVSRLEFHDAVQEALRERLLQQIDFLGKAGNTVKLEELLQKSFPVVKVDALRPVVMAILKNLEHVDERYLRRLVADKQLYQEADVGVKRQIWLSHQSLFGDEVLPLFQRYMKEREAALWEMGEAGASFYAPTPRQRRQHPIVQQLVTMVGRNVVLYDMVLQSLRTLFVRTKNVHYCTLRVELLMALHDADVQDITQIDSCHKFAWCLDACVRERNIDAKRSRELQGFLDGVKPGSEQVLGDIAMSLADPHATNFLVSSALKIIHLLINNESLPRDHTVLLLLMRMLSLGLDAWRIMTDQEFKEPKLDPQVVTKFLPSMMSLMVDDLVRQLNSRLPQDDRETAITTIEHSGPPPDAYQAYINESGVACILACYYTLHTVRTRDRTGLMRVLGVLSGEGPAYSDVFLHTLVGHLVCHLAEEFAHEDFCTVIFDEFFLTALARENVLRHLLRLVWHSFHKLAASRLDMLMKALQTMCTGNHNLTPSFEQLKERISTQQTSMSARVPQPTDSPVFQVPCTPHHSY